MRLMRATFYNILYNIVIMDTEVQMKYTSTYYILKRIQNKLRISLETFSYLLYNTFII